MAMCKHRPIRSDLGFLLCRDCDTVLDIPTLNDLVIAELKGAIWPPTPPRNLYLLIGSLALFVMEEELISMDKVKTIVVEVFVIIV